MYLKHIFSSMVAVAAGVSTYLAFELTFQSSPTEKEVERSHVRKEAPQYRSGGIDDKCNWVAVSITEPSMCYSNPVPSSYGPPSFLLVEKTGKALPLSKELCSQYQALESPDSGGSKTLYGESVKWICPVKISLET